MLDCQYNHDSLQCCPVFKYLNVLQTTLENLILIGLSWNSAVRYTPVRKFGVSQKDFQINSYFYSVGKH